MPFQPPSPMETFAPFLVFFLFFIGLAVAMNMIFVQRREQAKSDYQAALDRYRTNPTDPSLRQAAVEAGRLYSRSTRNQYGNSYFNESSIQNDLETVKAVNPISPQPPQSSIENRLLTLDGLLNQGLITQDEYQSRRAAILEEI